MAGTGIIGFYHYIHNYSFPAMNGNLVYDGKTYHLNRRIDTTEYYRCAFARSQECRARLVQRGGIITIRGQHTCENSNTQSRVDTSEYVENILLRTSSDLRLSPMSIYESLVESAHVQFQSAGFRIPNRRCIYERIRQLRGTTSSTVYEIDSPQQTVTVNGLPFLQRHSY